jgi:hypothetical protein
VLEAASSTWADVAMTFRVAGDAAYLDAAASIAPRR